MTEMPSCVVENPNFEPYKPKKQYNLYSGPILLSIITYIFIFHVLDMSPSSIFNDTKVLFFLSNALIIIIAVDYSTFSDKENHDVYDDYMAAMRSEAEENPRPGNSGYEGSFLEDIKIREKQEEAIGAKDAEKIVRVVSENRSRNITIQNYKPTIEQNVHKAFLKRETCNARNLVNPKRYGRSKSDKPRELMINKERRQEIKHRPKSYDQSQLNNSKWMVVHEEKQAEEATVKWENVKEESEEFSKMSNEELNRRVEDFIQRFNRNIKRQSFV